MTIWFRRAAGVLGILGAVAVLGLGVAGPAAAHPTLLFTEPAAETAVSVAPESITLIFNERVTIGADPVVVLGKDGRAVPTGAPTTARDGQVVTARPAAPLPPGSYTVRWRVTGTDGDLVEDGFRFGVGYALSAAPGAGTASTAWWSAALRWVLFAGLAIAFGGLIAQRFIATARAEKPALVEPRSPITGALVAALAATAGLATQVVAEAGQLSALWRSGTGAIVSVEAAGLAAALALTRMRPRAWALLPLLVVVGAEGWRSHAHAAAGVWGAVLTAVHLAAAAVWVGALVATTLAVLAWRREAAAVRWVLTGYMRLAVWTFVVVIGTGAVSALVLLPLSQVFATNYGRALLVKLALVATAAALALTARWILRDEARMAKLPKAIRAESLTLIVVLALSATLVSTPPVRGAVQPAPPPPPGPVLPLGALAGQIGVAVAASDGQLVVRLSAPRRGDYYAAEPDRKYTLSGRLDRTDGDDTALAFRGCGQGCFVADAAWSDGDNVLSLAAGADDAKSAPVSLLIPWPTLPGAEELGRAVAATRAAGQITVHESVTSDTTSGPNKPKPLDLSAEFFVSQQPYAGGNAPQAVRLAGSGPTRLALGYPAASINVVLTLDDAGRIADETLTDPSHLVTQRIVYQDDE
ncbi:copper resistance CopC/CopD family protein [Mycobacterium hubeiense]|uniref:copper resistance CopC/CopD family protein n=1 Tax=Mycobacterium hubeiense TaxID=1867256 RepID=UPI000C7EE4C7|nr:copper resistance protein CopC [Mycobacterium sp. QGD 101]